MKDRQFTPLVETGPDGGTVPVSKMIAPADMFNPRSRLNEFRSLSYQPSQGEPYVLAAHITGKPRDRVGGSPINVVLVADVDAVNDELFEMREKGQVSRAGYRVRFRQRHLRAQCSGHAGGR